MTAVVLSVSSNFNSMNFKFQLANSREDAECKFASVDLSSVFENLPPFEVLLKISVEKVSMKPQTPTDDSTITLTNNTNPNQSNIPADNILMSERAKLFWKRLRRAGFVDKKNQPLNLSWCEKGLLAVTLSHELNIVNTWKTFSEYWGVSKHSLRSGYNKIVKTKKVDSFKKRIVDAISN